MPREKVSRAKLAPKQQIGADVVVYSETIFSKKKYIYMEKWLVWSTTVGRYDKPNLLGNVANLIYSLNLDAVPFQQRRHAAAADQMQHADRPYGALFATQQP